MSDGTELCPVSEEPMTRDQDLEYWGEVERIHAECNPERKVGWEP